MLTHELHAGSFTRIGESCVTCEDTTSRIIWAAVVCTLLFVVVCYSMHSQRSKRGSTKLSTTSAVRIGLTYVQLASLSMPVRAARCWVAVLRANPFTWTLAAVPSGLADTYASHAAAPGLCDRPAGTRT